MYNFGQDSPNRGAGRGVEPRGVRIRNSVDIGGFLGILSRQRLWIVAGFVIAFGLAFFYIATAPLTYTSTISILIDARGRQPVGSDQASLPQTADPIMVESQLKLMTSEAVFRRVVMNEHLESDPDFAPSDHVGLISGILGLIERGKMTAPPMEQITGNLFARTSVKRPDRTYVADMDVRAGSPEKAARLADAIAKAFLEEQRAASDAYAQEQSDWVVKRTEELRARVEEAEKKVQDYKASNGIVDVAGTLTQEQQLQDANRDLVAARAKAGEAQARVDQIRRIIASGKALDGTYDTINSTVIRQLRVQYSDLIRRQAAASQKYGTRHPEYLDIQEQLQAVKGQIAEEMQRISSALTNEAQVARGNEDAAQKRVQILETKTTDTNQTSLKLRELQRQADSDRTNYEKFLRANDSIRRDPTEMPYARIVAPASFPTAPSSPRVVAALLIAAAAGLSLGIGLAITMDYRQMARVQYPASPGSGPGIGPGGGYGPTNGPFQSGPPMSQGGQYYGPSPGGGQVFGVPREGAARSEGIAPADGSGPGSETGFAKLRTIVTGRRPLVRDPRVMAETVTQPQSQAPSYYPGRAPTAAATTAPARDAAPGHAGQSFGAYPGTYQAGVAAPAVDTIDPRDLLSGVISDLANDRMRRLILTARMPTAQKTELVMTLARAAAARGHAVLVIDGDGRDRALSRMAMREGLPARIHFDQMQINVFGIPCAGEGVVFVLPLEAVTGNMDHVDMPFIDVRLGAVLVDGPALGPDLLGFTGIADTCLVLDERGYLTSMGLAQAAEQANARIAAAATPDMDPRRFAQTQFT